MNEPKFVVGQRVAVCGQSRVTGSWVVVPQSIIISRRFVEEGELLTLGAIRYINSNKGGNWQYIVAGHNTGVPEYWLRPLLDSDYTDTTNTAELARPSGVGV